MGTFSVPVQVGSPAGGAFIQVEALVDTGATDTLLPQGLLLKLGIATKDRDVYKLADGSTVSYAVGEAVVRLDGRERTVLVVFGPEDAQPLLGATTLELFKLSVDPVARRLVPVPGLLK